MPIYSRKHNVKKPSCCCASYFREVHDCYLLRWVSAQDTRLGEIGNPRIIPNVILRSRCAYREMYTSIKLYLIIDQNTKPHRFGNNIILSYFNTIGILDSLGILSLHFCNKDYHSNWLLCCLRWRAYRKYKHARYIQFEYICLMREKHTRLCQEIGLPCVN